MQAYADRGVFRGFRAAPGRGGAVDYSLLWLAPRPLVARYTPARRVLAFPSLFAGLGPRSAIAADLSAAVAARTTRQVPAHKRVDGRRVRLATSVRQGDWSLTVTLTGRDPAAGVSAALGVVHDLWLVLQERYPDYLSERFGLPQD